MKTCSKCGSTEQVSSTQDGDFCFNHYRIYKRGKSVGVAVPINNCENCGEPTSIAGQCVRCGNHLTSDGSVIRVGGHEDC